MAVYRLLQVKYWQNDFILDLDTKERLFYGYLLTCIKTTQCGIYKLQTVKSKICIHIFLQKCLEEGGWKP
jgi:hypothetical protein